jgi:hypothetical protein
MLSSDEGRMNWQSKPATTTAMTNRDCTSQDFHDSTSGSGVTLPLAALFILPSSFDIGCYKGATKILEDPQYSNDKSFAVAAETGVQFPGILLFLM